MVDDEKYEVAFEIIACAGDAKSLALMAIEEARNGNFEQAEKNPVSYTHLTLPTILRV